MTKCWHVNHEIGLPTPVVVKFSSVSRDDTYAELIHYPSQTWEEWRSRYAVLFGGEKVVAKWVDTIYPCDREQKSTIELLALNAIRFCESRYGYSVEDYDEHDADCVLTIT